MSILPFGCRAFVVKPRIAFSKTRMEPTAWVRMKLGRSVRSPGAYHVSVGAELRARGDFVGRVLQQNALPVPKRAATIGFTFTARRRGCGSTARTAVAIRRRR
eukprot:5350279-Pleurochrysis_carterae.AAC.2